MVKTLIKQEAVTFEILKYVKHFSIANMRKMFASSNSNPKPDLQIRPRIYGFIRLSGTMAS